MGIEKQDAQAQAPRPATAGKRNRQARASRKQARQDGKKPRGQRSPKQLARIAAIAVGLAVAAMVIGGGLIASSLAMKQSLTADMVRVAVAKGDIETGAQLVAGQSYEFRDVPKSYVPNGAVTETDSGKLNGKTAVTDIPKGSVVTTPAVNGYGTSTSLANALASGKEGITIATETQNALDGHLYPGDRVRIIDTDTGFTLVEDATVIGLGSKLTHEDAGYNSVSLMVDPADADKLATRPDAKSKFRIVVKATVQGGE